jgi:phospholipase/carboxylesterase
MKIKLVIFLHGVGSQGADLLSVGKFWQHYYPELKIAAAERTLSVYE